MLRKSLAGVPGTVTAWVLIPSTEQLGHTIYPPGRIGATWVNLVRALF